MLIKLLKIIIKGKRTKLEAMRNYILNTSMHVQANVLEEEIQTLESELGTLREEADRTVEAEKCIHYYDNKDLSYIECTNTKRLLNNCHHSMHKCLIITYKKE